MTIKLKGSTDGSVSLTAPADTSPSGDDITLTLPTTAGSANEFVKNSGTAGTLEYSDMVETSTGIGIGTSSPASKVHIVDSLNGGQLLVSSAQSASDVEKYGSFGTEHYNADEEPGLGIAVNSSSTANTVLIGGGLGEFNAASYIRFYTGSSNDTTTGTQRMVITDTGDIYIRKGTGNIGNIGIELLYSGLGSFTREGGACLRVNRKVSDGTLVQFYQAGVQEGKISVSGTTVSYQGGHLARWSQLPGGAERTEILRGSVLTNLDEMCEWGDEDNEQLNRMQVSTVEGDPNVAGVFESWDDDDDDYTNDLNVAMTGDFVIRIAQGTTVARGDLLMSAGDGTAKPQDDDIVRSKTIAKVTSTVVSETYADGSYCVPCVLMAC